jgi:hypothetical protein
MTDFFETLRAEITRANALELLRDVACPYCANVGEYQLFDEINNNGVGIRCRGCDKHHPFVKQHIMWLRSGEKRRSNDIVAVTKECGAYCWGCGMTFDDLMRYGIGIQVHHTRPFAEHGETYKKIPMCADCHEAANLIQRIHRRLAQR